MTAGPDARAKLFCSYARAAELLRQRFGDDKGDPFGQELLATFALERTIDVTRLQLELEELAQIVLPLGFRLVLHTTAYGNRARFRLQLANDRIEVTIEDQGKVPLKADDPLDAAAQAALRSFLEILAKPRNALAIDELLQALDGLDSARVPLDLELGVHLDNKEAVARRFAAGGAPADRPKPVVFLFPEAAARYLEGRSLAALESELFQPGTRTVVLVFGLDGGFGNGLLDFAGRSWLDRLDAALTEPVPPEVLDHLDHVRQVRDSSGVWLQPASWLVPEHFEAPGADDARTDPEARPILRQLRVVRGELAAIFLADRAESVPGASDAYRVEYRGFGQVSLEISRQRMLELETGPKPVSWDALYGLYRYAYQGYSVDKIEFAQKFLSLLAKDERTLASKAHDVERTTKQTYDNALRQRVAEYFDARHKIQERIKTAVAEASDSVLGLTREVSGDLYKVAGLALAGLVGAFLKPDLTAIALLTVASAIAIYVLLVLALHLPTVRETYQVRLAQHEDYIQSFAEILSKDEIRPFLEDPRLRSAKDILERKLQWAEVIYVVFLVIAGIVALGAWVNRWD